MMTLGSERLGPEKWQTQEALESVLQSMLQSVLAVLAVLAVLLE
jgi:hypothetical protein